MLKENALFETVKMQALPPPITLISSKHLHVILFKQPQEGLLSTYLKYEPRIRLYNYHMAIEEAEHKNLNDLESGDKKKRPIWWSEPDCQVTASLCFCVPGGCPSK